jgi:hypothetical protein
MSIGSTLDPDAVSSAAAARPPGHDNGSLGPSDLSDTGSDSVGSTGLDPAILADDGDSTGTGVDPSPADRRSDDVDADIGFDRVVTADEAGLGGGLDQAEEARYGITDEALDPVDEAGASVEPPVASRRRAHPGRGAPSDDDALRDDLPAAEALEISGEPDVRLAGGDEGEDDEAGDDAA